MAGLGGWFDFCVDYIWGLLFVSLDLGVLGGVYQWWGSLRVCFACCFVYLVVFPRCVWPVGGVCFLKVGVETWALLF